MTDLDQRLHAADPARDVSGYDDASTTRLLDHICAGDATELAPTRRASGRGRRWTLALAVAGMAGVLTLTPVGLRLSDDSPGGSGHGGLAVVDAAASAEASELLHRAAAVTPTDPPVRAGQYWKITRVARENSSESRAVAGAPGGFDTAKFMVTNTRVQYLPVDGHGIQWSVSRTGVDPVHVSGPRDWFTPAVETDVIALDPGPTEVAGNWVNPSVAFFGAMPTEPTALRARLYTWDGEGDPYRPPAEQPGGPNTFDADGYAFSKAADILSDGRAPARLRSAALEVLRTISGVQITDRAASVAGQAGVSIGRALGPESDYRQIVIDPTDGVVLGERWVVGPLNTGHGDVAGAVRAEVSFTRELVDTVPRDVRDGAERP